MSILRRKEASSCSSLGRDGYDASCRTEERATARIADVACEKSGAMLHDSEDEGAYVIPCVHVCFRLHEKLQVLEISLPASDQQPGVAFFLVRDNQATE